MKIGIIIGSVRQGRVSDKYAKWIADELVKKEEVEVSIIDLKDYQLPMMDEAISPQFNPNREVSGSVKDWLDKLAEQDSYIVVTPEYNRSISGVLSNALDFVAFQMAKKPVGIATHGSSFGAQAVSHLRGIIPGLQAITIPTFLGMPYADMLKFSDDGQYTGENAEYRSQALTGFIDELIWYTGKLKETN